jgi:methyl-accepting chemotaxis protein
MVFFKNKNISVQLLRKIFSIYILLAIFITIIQIFFEFKNVKNNIFRDFKGLQSTFGQSLGQSLFREDKKAYKKIAFGMMNFSSVKRVIIIDVDGKEVRFDQSKKESPSFFNFLSRYSFFHSFEQIFRNSKIVYPVGHVFIYSNYKEVFLRVQNNLMILLINSFLKAFLLWVIMSFFIHRILEFPLKNFILKIDNIHFEKFSPLQTEGKEDNELKHLKIKFNGLMEKLKESKRLLLVQSSETRLKNNELINLKKK